MSSFTGLLGSMAPSFLSAALDPSHHPFKRSARRPGGPAGRSDSQTHRWECEWVKPKDGYYRQKCTDLAHPKRKPKMVKIPKAKKKAYNKAYRKGKFPKGRAFKVDKRHAAAAYKPQRSRTWAAHLGKKKR